jgi:response regulator RpfG family c-di-GMP phosphodiesterase
MHKILLVDDDENILFGYQRNLRTKFNVSISTSAAEALGLISKTNDFAVVISDFNMPGMKGVEFLSKVKELSPDTVRILLTGYADVKTSMDAVNEGNIFRLLTKPCPQEMLLQTIYQAIHQYNLVISERELLEKTLRGSIKMLVDILAVINPLLFNHAKQNRNLGKQISLRLGVKNTWEIEIGCLLSQIGCIGIPAEVVDKKLENEKLTPAEENLFFSHPDIGKSLLENIPRLENIAEALAYQYSDYNGSANIKEFKVGDNIPFLGRILKVLNDFNQAVSMGMTQREAISVLESKRQSYDPEILAALDAEIKGAAEGYSFEYIELKNLKPGMILAEGMTDVNGVLLLPKDSEISEISLIRVLNYSKVRKIKEPIKILLKKAV